MNRKTKRLHCPNPTDHGVALCGTSREGDKSVMWDVEVAKVGETITCGRCKALISLIRIYIGPRYTLRSLWRKVAALDK